MFTALILVCPLGLEEATAESCRAMTSSNVFPTEEACIEELGTGAQAYADMNGVAIWEGQCIRLEALGPGNNDA